MPERVGRLHVRQVGDRIVLGFARPGSRTDGTPLGSGARVELMMSLRDPAPKRPRDIEADPSLSWTLPAGEWRQYEQGSRLEVGLTLGRIARDLEIPGGPSSLKGRRLSFVAQVVEGKRERSDPSDIETFVVCDPPPPPGRFAARIAQEGILLSWFPGAPAPAAAAAVPGVTAEPRFNIYRRRAGPESIPEELVQTAASSERSWLDAGAAIGIPWRYEIRSAGAGSGCESAGADPLDLTRVDLFPPEPPQGLAAVAEEGAIRLFWRSNRELDLRGYRVYRAGGAQEAFRLLTTEDLTTTSYTDEDVEPGVVYIYAVTARDGAAPPNESLFSEQAIETMKTGGKDETP